MEVSTTSHKLSALQAELDAKENDAQTQRQQKEQAGKYEERLRALNTEIRTLRKRQNEYTPLSLSIGSRPNPHTSHPTSTLYRYTKLSKLNADRSKEISKLQGQISEMKHAKVAIQRKASEESSQYRDWRQARMREISQLRREARVSKLEEQGRYVEASSLMVSALTTAPTSINSSQYASMHTSPGASCVGSSSRCAGAFVTPASPTPRSPLSPPTEGHPIDSPGASMMHSALESPAEMSLMASALAAAPGGPSSPSTPTHGVGPGGGPSDLAVSIEAMPR